MIWEIRFTAEAEETYDAIIAQLDERWGEKFALKFEARLEKVLNQLSESPFLYPIVYEAMEIRRCILHKNCSLLYKVAEKQVVVLCFWDNRQEPLFDSTTRNL